MVRVTVRFEDEQDEQYERLRERASTRGVAIAQLAREGVAHLLRVAEARGVLPTAAETDSASASRVRE